MSDNIASQFRKLEAEYCCLLKYLSKFEKIKEKLACEERGERLGDVQTGKSLGLHQMKIISENAKKDLKTLAVSLKKIEAHIKHSVGE